jgi:hypothetical protein
MKKPAHNRTYNKLAVQWLNETLCFVSSSVVADSFRLRNRQLLVAANRCAAYKKSQHTNSTFGFCRHAKPTLKKPKELFFANARPKNEQNTENRNKRYRMNSIFRNLKPTEEIWS